MGECIIHRTVIKKSGATLQDFSWSEIKMISDALVSGIISKDTLETKYNIRIGDTKSATINGETHDYRLIGILHDISGSGDKLGFTFEQVDCLQFVDGRRQITMLNNPYAPSSMSSTDGWNYTWIRNELNGMSIEDDLANVITRAAKTFATSVSDGTEYTAYNQPTFKLWLMSEKELCGTTYYSICKTEGTQYEYYAKGGDKTKLDGWGTRTVPYWLRSAYQWDGSKSYYACFASYFPMYSAADFDYNVAPCFCI